MRDLAYFQTSIEPEAPEGSVGGDVARALREHFVRAGATLGELQPWYDGYRLTGDGTLDLLPLSSGSRPASRQHRLSGPWKYEP